jgi:hypothetical protein
MIIVGQTGEAFAAVPILLLLGGWLSGGIAIAEAKKIGSRWSTVASVGIWVSLLEIVLICVLVLYVALSAYQPGR